LKNACNVELAKFDVVMQRSETQCRSLPMQSHLLAKIFGAKLVRFGQIWFWAKLGQT